MRKSKFFYLKNAGRWFRIILAIQLLLWAIGGFYFSRNSVYKESGKEQNSIAPLLSVDGTLVSPNVVIDEIRKRHRADSIAFFQLAQILKQPFYQVRIICMEQNETSHGHGEHIEYLVNASNGQIRAPLSEEEAREMAKYYVPGANEIKSVKYLTSFSGTRNYTKLCLPVYAVSFTKPLETIVYVSAQLGTVEKFSTVKSIKFDPLWIMPACVYDNSDLPGKLLLLLFFLFTVLIGIFGLLNFSGSTAVESDK